MKKIIVSILLLGSFSAIACDTLIGTYKCNTWRSFIDVSLDDDGVNYIVIEYGKDVIFGGEWSISKTGVCENDELVVDRSSGPLKQFLFLKKENDIVIRKFNTYSKGEVISSDLSECKFYEQLKD